MQPPLSLTDLMEEAYDPPDFAAALERFVHRYEGARRESVSLAPTVFAFYGRLFSDRRIHRDARTVVNAVLAYFVVPDDIMPEHDLGPMGLMDDLYVAAHAHRILRREVDADVLAQAWTGEGDLDVSMALVYSESRAALGKRTRDALRMAGLAL